MFDKFQTLLRSKRLKQLTDVRNLGLYVFGVVVLAIAWSGAKTVQSNYELQKRISTLQQQNVVIKLQNDNAALQNEYFQTSQYLDLSARQNLGLAAPGETVMIVPQQVSARYINHSLDKLPGAVKVAAADDRHGYVKNLEAWRDFLLGRKASGN